MRSSLLSLTTALLLTFATPTLAAPTIDVFKASDTATFQQLQKADTDLIILLAIEHLSSEQIQTLQAQGKRVVATINIAEAKTSDSFWNPAWETATQSGGCFVTFYRQQIGEFDSRRCRPEDDKYSIAKPAWLGPQNIETLTYHVRYWQQEWWKLAVQPQLDMVRAQGLDGVYIEADDAIDFWKSSEEGFSRQHLSQKMAQLLLSTYYTLPKSSNLVVSDNNEGVSFLSNYRFRSLQISRSTFLITPQRFR